MINGIPENCSVCGEESTAGLIVYVDGEDKNLLRELGSNPRFCEKHVREAVRTIQSLDNRSVLSDVTRFYDDDGNFVPFE